LSQLTLPWVTRDPAAYQGYRRTAIRNLLALGVAHLVLAGAVYKLLDVGSATQIADWKILAAWVGVIGPALGGVVFTLGGLAVLFFRQVVWLFKLRYTAVKIFFGGVIAVCLVV